MARDRNETIYRVLVEDIFLAVENDEDLDEDDLTEPVVESVIQKIEAMDFSDMADTIRQFIDDAMREQKKADALEAQKILRI